MGLIDVVGDGHVAVDMAMFIYFVEQHDSCAVPLRFAHSVEPERQTRSSLLQHALRAAPRSSPMIDGCRTCQDCESSNFTKSHNGRTNLSHLSCHRPRTAAVFARNSVSQLSTTIVSGTLSSTAAIITNFRPSGVTS